MSMLMSIMTLRRNFMCLILLKVENIPSLLALTESDTLELGLLRFIIE